MLSFYNPVNPLGSCRTRPIYPTSHLLLFMSLYLDKLFHILSSSFKIGTLSSIILNISGSFGLYVDTYGTIFSSDFSVTVRRTSLSNDSALFMPYSIICNGYLCFIKNDYTYIFYERLTKNVSVICASTWIDWRIADAITFASPISNLVYADFVCSTTCQRLCFILCRLPK